ncbi:MAG: substrate-binding periplasmic protein [Rhodoferax sp.]
MKRLFPITRLAAALCASACHLAPAADLVAYTEDWPPYNHIDNGQVRGIASDALRAACALAQLHCQLELVPWARAYKSASMEPNTLVYTTARKPSREAEFLWVGPILPRATWVYLRNDPGVHAANAAELAPLRVGVVRGEAAQQDLLAAGVPESALQAHASNADVFRLLRAGTLDAMVETEVGMQWTLRTLGLPAGAVRQAFKLSEEGAYYYALNRKTDPLVVQKLQAAFEQVRASGQLQKIVRDYTQAVRP